MINKIRHYYDLMGDLNYCNLILKLSLTVTGTALVCSLFVILYLSTRAPLLIYVEPSGDAIKAGFQMDSDKNVSENEIQHFITEFISLRYNWTPQNVEERYAESKRFMDSGLLKKLEAKSKEDIGYVKQTGLNQTVYVRSIQPNGTFNRSGKFNVICDRIINVGKARFTSALEIEVIVEKNTRSKENLSGLSVIDIKEKGKQN